MNLHLAFFFLLFALFSSEYSSQTWLYYDSDNEVMIPISSDEEMSKKSEGKEPTKSAPLTSTYLRPPAASDTSKVSALIESQRSWGGSGSRSNRRPTKAYLDVDLTAEMARERGIRGGTIKGREDVAKFVEMFDESMQSHLRQVTEGYNNVEIEVEGPQNGNVYQEIGNKVNTKMEEEKRPKFDARKPDTRAKKKNDTIRGKENVSEFLGMFDQESQDHLRRIMEGYDNVRIDLEGPMGVVIRQDDGNDAYTADTENEPSPRKMSRAKDKVKKIAQKTWHTLRTSGFGYDTDQNDGHQQIGPGNDSHHPQMGSEKSTGGRSTIHPERVRPIEEGGLTPSRQTTANASSSRNTTTNTQSSNDIPTTVTSTTILFNPPTSEQQKMIRNFILNPAGEESSKSKRKNFKIENKFNHDGDTFKSASSFPKRTEENNGGGDCLFRSFAYALAGTEQLHLEVRQLFVDYYSQFIGTENNMAPDFWLRQMLLNDRFNNFHFRTIKKYVEYLAIPGKWGGVVDVMAATKIFNVNVCLYNRVHGGWFCYSPETEPNQDENVPTVFLQFLEQTDGNNRTVEHYNVVLSVKDRSRSRSMW